jgi:hypothetical protein
MEMTSRQKLNAVGQAMAEVSRLLASGELDSSSRYYTDAELSAGVKRASQSELKQTQPDWLRSGRSLNPLV